ncbi:hypothetical protein DdX_08568 [Ditylenchus destructor]|uniref:Uncharacterized protein n=1 Tax=Ditylenchus destructor TaxID=166010 RepID=A0AAD4N2M4_9BILA|nr:hypothetical protein DdX_08568 [Ditylenchus destructor]
MTDNGESTESVEIERPATDVETSVETTSPTKSMKDPTTVSLASTDDYVQLDYDDSNIEAVNENGLSDNISTSLVVNEEIFVNADEMPSSTIPAVDELEELPDDEECSVAIGLENCEDNNENASILEKANEIKETNSCMSSEEVVLEVNDIEVKSEPMGELNEPTEAKPDSKPDEIRPQKQPRTPPDPCPDNGDEDEEDEDEDEGNDVHSGGEGYAQTHKPDEDEKATEAEQAVDDREKEEKQSRKRRAAVPRAYQLPPRKKHDENESRIVTKRRRSMPLDESIEARMARNRRLRMQRILAARRQRITEMSRADARFRRSPLPSSSRYDSDRRNSDKLRYPSRRSPVSHRRRSPLPLVRLQVSPSPKRRYSPRRNNDNRRYGSSSRRSRSPAISYRGGSSTTARRYDAGPSRPAFVGNDQYRIYIRSETERRPARRERTPPRYRRTPPGSSRSRHEPMRMERGNSRNGRSIPSLLSIKTAPVAPPPSRRRHARSPPQSFYVRGDDDDRRRPSSRSHWRRTPREQSPR